MYFDQATACITELSDAIDRGEPVVVAKTSHKLKGSSGTLGAARVAQVAAELEETAKAGDLSAARELLDRLQAALGETGAAFRGLAATTT
jgi:HPt (histidine-containing phosphotransfer) domain-containing protein